MTRGYAGRRGSRKWRGIAKRYVYNGVDSYNRLFAMLLDEPGEPVVRLKVTRKPRIGKKAK